MEQGYIVEPKRRRIVVLIAGVITVLSACFVAYRGGLIAWTAMLCGLALLGKVWKRPGRADLGFSIGLAFVAITCWLATHNYVISTYESGEVVELAIDTSNGLHAVRLWVFELDTTPTVYYDADPAAAASLLAARPLQYTRADRASTIIPLAIKAEQLDEQSADEVFQAMAAKYGSRMTAADVYYVLLGSPRNRIPLVVKLQEP